MSDDPARYLNWIWAPVAGFLAFVWRVLALKTDKSDSDAKHADNCKRFDEIVDMLQDGERTARRDRQAVSDKLHGLALKVQALATRDEMKRGL